MHRNFGVATLVRILFAVALMLALVACTSATSGSGTTGGTATPAITGSTDPGAQLVQAKCTMCHTIDRVEEAEKSREEWVTSVDRMKSNGLVVTDAEYATIVDFLSGTTK